MSILRATRPIAFLLLITLWPALGLAQATAPAGVVTSLQGRATVARPVLPQPIPLKFKDDLFLRDQVATGEKSVVRVLLAGKALVTIRALSTVRITEEPGRAVVDLTNGKLAVGVAKSLLKPGEAIEIRTPNAITAIRGSFLVASFQIVNGVAESIFTALDASVPITVTPVGGGTGVVLGTNQAVGVSGSAANAVIGPVQNISPAAARVEAQTASVPPGAEQNLSSPMAAQIGEASAQQAIILASLIAPSTGTTTPPATSSGTSTAGTTADPVLTSATQTQLLQQSGSTLSTVSQTVVASMPPPPSTGALGVNATSNTSAATSNSSGGTGGGTTGGTTGGTGGGTTGGGTTGGTGGGTTGGTGGGTTGGTPGGTGGPGVISGQNLVLAPNDTLITFSGTSSSTATTPAVTVSNSTVSGADNLIKVDPGANASLQGPLLDASGAVGTPSMLSSNSSVMDIRGVISTTSLNAFINVDPTVIATTDFLRIVGGSLAVAGPLLTDVQGLYQITGDFLSVSGGGSLSGASVADLLQFSNSTVFVGAPGALNPSRFFALDGIGSTANLGGSLASFANNSALTINGPAGSALLSITSGATLNSPSASPVLNSSGSTLSLGAGVRGFLASGGTATVGGSLLRATAASTVLADQTVPLVDLSNSAVSITGALIRLEGGSTLQSGGIKVSGGSLTADSLLSTDGASNTAAVTGTALDLSNTSVTLRAIDDKPLVHTDTTSLSLGLNQPAFRLSSSALSLTGPGERLIKFGFGDSGGSIPTEPGVALIVTGTSGSPSAVNLKGTLLRLKAVNSTTTQAMVQLDHTTVNQTGTTDNLISAQVPLGLSTTMSGQLLTAAATTVNTSGSLFQITGGSLTSNTTLPFLFLDPSSVTTAENFMRVTGGATLTLKGSLLEATDTGFTATSNQFSFFSVDDGGSVITAGTSAPLLKFTGTAPGLSKVTAARSFLPLSISGPGQPIPSMTLSGPLLGATATDFKIGDPTSNTFTLLFVGDSATLSSTSTSPLISLDNSTIDTAGAILSLRRSTSGGAPSKLTLSGPLFSAVNGSSLNTTSLGFFQQFGTVAAACCTPFSVTQGAQLTGTTTAPLIQLSNSTLTGIDLQSGGSVFAVSDTFNGAPANELVAPSSVTLSGPLLSVSGGSLSALFNLLSVTRSNFTSTSPNPLIQFNGTTVNVGGFDPFAGANSNSRIVVVSASSTTPAALSLQGPLVSATGSAITSGDEILGVFNGASLTSAGTSPLISISGGSATAGTAVAPGAGGNFISFASNLGLSPSVGLSGPLLNAVNTTLKNGDPTSNTYSFVFVGDSATVTSTGGAPLFSFDNTSLNTSGGFFTLRRSLSGANPTTLTLSGPLFVASNGSSFDVTSAAFGSACCTGFFLGQGARLSSTSTAPLIQLTSSTFNAGDAQSGGNLIGVFDTGACCGETNLLVAPSKITLGGALLNAAGGSISALFNLLSIRRSDLTSTSPNPLIELNSSTVSLGGFNPFTNSIANAGLLNLSGSAGTAGTLSLNGPLVAANSSNITTTAEPFGIFAGGSLTATGTVTPLISFSGGTLNAGAHLVHIRGFATGGSVPATLTLSGPLFSENGATLNVTGNLLRLADGGSLSSTTTSPLIGLTGGSFTGAPAGSVRGGSLLRMFSEVGQSGTSLSIAGPYLASSGTNYTAPDASAFNIADGASISSSGLGTFASFTGGSLSSAFTFFVMGNHTSFTTPGQPTTVGNGVISTVNLAGPLFSFRNNSVTVGNPTINTAGLMFISNGSLLVGTGSNPLLSFDGASVDVSGGIFTLRRSASVVLPSKLTLSGPLFSAVNNSSFNTTSLGFGSSFNVAGSTCCDAFFISQGAQLISATSAPLIQLSNSTFNAGPDVQSGGDFFGVFNTFNGVPASELVAPASVSLSGPLLMSDASTITALFSLISIGRSTLTSSSANALIQLNNSSVSLGGLNPFGNTVTFGRLLNLVSSAPSGSVASPASLSLSGAGPLLLATNSTLNMTADLVGVFNGATLNSASGAALLQTNGGSLTTNTAAGFNGFLLDVSGTGGPSGTGLATVTLNGPLYTGTATLSLAGGLANVTNGGQVVVSGLVDPFVSVTGGTHTINGSPGFAMFRLLGRNLTAFDAESGLNLGTDRMIQGPVQLGGTMPVPTSLLETVGATVTGQKVLKIDHALLEATAPLLNLKANGATPSVLTTTGTDAVDLSFNARVASLGSSLIRLDGSTLNVNGGALVNVNASKLTTSGDLVNLLNGATLSVLNGPLIRVGGGGFVNVAGALINFGGTGGNNVNITNSLCPCTLFSGIPVALQNGAQAVNVQIGPNPIRNTGLGQVNLSSNAALAVVNGASSRLTVVAP